MILTLPDHLIQEQLSQNNRLHLGLYDKAGEVIVQHLICKDQRLMQQIEAGFYALLDAPTTHKSHFFGERYENIYPAITALPQLLPLRDAILIHVCQQTNIPAEDTDALRFGFWFNLMQPGHSTSMHTHEDAEEIVSGVCYLQVPEGSGAIVFVVDGEEHRRMPQAGDILLFPPSLPHAVDTNHSPQARLSLAFNIGF